MQRSTKIAKPGNDSFIDAAAKMQKDARSIVSQKDADTIANDATGRKTNAKTSDNAPRSEKTTALNAAVS